MESGAKLLGHPLHPVLVVFPLGLFKRISTRPAHSQNRESRQTRGGLPEQLAARACHLWI
jgi:hypothetical protein